MHLTTVIVSAALGFAVGSSGWAQKENGEWIANNNMLVINGRYVNEPCTTRGTNEFRESGPCSYWADSKGTIVVGTCSTAPDNNDAGETVMCGH